MPPTMWPYVRSKCTYARFDQGGYMNLRVGQQLLVQHTELDEATGSKWHFGHCVRDPTQRGWFPESVILAPPPPWLPPPVPDQGASSSSTAGSSNGPVPAGLVPSDAPDAEAQDERVDDYANLLSPALPAQARHAHNQGADASWPRRMHVSDGRSAHDETGSPSAFRMPAPLRSQVGQSLRVCICGDSGVQLNKSKGTAGFEADLKWELGENLEIRRLPAEGATAIARYLRGQVGNSQIVVAVWLLNEAFANRGLRSPYPEELDALADELSSVLRMFPYRGAIIGGTAAMWDVPQRFDAYAERVRARMRRAGVVVLDGVEAYSQLEFAAGDKWHARSTPKNKRLLARYFANLARDLVS